MTLRHVPTIAGLLLILLSASAVAQQDDEVAPFRFAPFWGVNYNMIGVDGDAAAAALNAAQTIEPPIESGTGLAPYGGLMFEYNGAPDGILGFQVRLSYDDRKGGLVEDTDTVDASVRYLAIEPGLRISPFDPNFHFMIGPAIEFNLDNEFDYTLNGIASTQNAETDRFNDIGIGVWGGVGYDIPVSSMSSYGTRWYMTPFVEASLLPGQMATVDGGNANDAWSTTTIRAGLQLKPGWGGNEEMIADTPPPTGDVNMLIATPVGGVMAQRPMIEYLPILPHVFYGASETDAPSRYATLTPAQAASFDENSLTAMDSPSAGDPDGSTRSQRQLDVYYNVVNILADRLQKNRTTNIEVVGSGPDVAAATARAEKVKNYLVNSFDIPADRISSRGQKLPVHKSGTPSTPAKDKPLINDENVRVEILSDGNEDLFRPVKLDVFQDMPIENDMAITVKTTKPMSRWSMRVQGNGVDREYGPFYGNTAYVNATPILGDRKKGKYTATINATGADGSTMTTSETFDLEKTNLDPVTSTRYSILFRYDDSESLERFSTFLRGTVAGNIPDGSIVYIHGHSDVVGQEEYNYNLSVKRAEAAEKILADELKKQGKDDVTFESYGFGETTYRSPFDNGKPETRHYNRTVMIEIIPDAE